LVAHGLRRTLAAQFYPSGDLELSLWNQEKQKAHAHSRVAQPEVSREWESAAKSYVSIWASRAQLDSKPLFDAMHTMRRALVFPVDKQSPQFPRQANSTSPPNLEEWQEALRQAAASLSESTTP
jgi:hypothetical protein